MRCHSSSSLAHVPVIHASSHFDHKKRVAWVPILCIRVVPFSIIMGLRLAALRAAGAPLIYINSAPSVTDARTTVQLFADDMKCY